MTLNVSRRHEAVGELVCRTALHVGGWEPSAAADLAVSRDGLDRPIIPGTSVAGALRGWLASVVATSGRAAFTVRDIDRIFGWLEPGTESGGPARIRVDDAQVIDALVEPVIRDGVAIDRRTGAAATGFLYEREVLPAGTRFGFRLLADEHARPGPGQSAPELEDLNAKVVDAFSAIVAALHQGRISVGAARTRGLGEVVLDDVQVRVTDLSRRDDLVAWLSDPLSGFAPYDDTPTEEDGGPDVPLADQQMSIEILWEPVTSVMVKDSLEGAVVDTLPLTEIGGDGRTRLLLPGASVKGVLRAHAERIVRTLLGVNAPASMTEVVKSERLDGVSALFGAAGNRSRGPKARTAAGGAGAAEPSGPAGPAGWRGALVIADCHSVNGFVPGAWQDVVTAHPAQTAGPNGDRDRDAERLALRGKLDALNDSVSFRIADHVAIDRWTGGAADNLLFSVLHPETVAWEPIRLRVDLRRLARAEETTHLALALVLLVLRDLADGWLTLGFGGTRGHGHLKVRGVRFTGNVAGGPWAELPGRDLVGILEDPPPGVVEAMSRWAARFPDPATQKEALSEVTS